MTPVFGKSTDVSTWQGVINWDIMRSRVDECIIRVGSINSSTGVCYEDYRWASNIRESSSRNFKKLGGYWFFRPNFSATLQADYFTAKVLQHVKDLDDFVFDFDLEVTGGLSPRAVADASELFINRVMSNTGKLCWFYTRASFYNPYVESRPLFKTMKLHIARYSNLLTHPWNDDLRYKPKDWDDWAWWQFSADGNFLGSYYGASSSHIDVNYINPFIEEPVEPSDLLQYRVIMPTLNVREQPSINSRIVGTLSSDDVVTIEDVGGTDVWVKHQLGWSAVVYNGRRYMEKI